MRNFFTGLGACLVVVLAACGGRVGDIGPGGGGSSSGGTSSGGTSSGGGSGGGSGSSGGTRTCGNDADCGPGYQCGFPESDHCSAIGTCYSIPGSMCELYQPGCACGGTTINIACTGLPDGYSPQPLQYPGPCKAPPPLFCKSQQDCPVELVCAFPIAQGCSAQGQCLMRGPVCNMPSPIGCACDGTDVAYGTCSGLPDGYSPKPFAYPGPCETMIDAGAGD